MDTVGSSAVSSTAGGGTEGDPTPGYGAMQQLYVEPGRKGDGEARAEQLEGNISPVTGISSEEGERAAADEDPNGDGQKSGWSLRSVPLLHCSSTESN